MKVFIRATSCISPQETFDNKLFSFEPKEYTKGILDIIEPDYKGIIDVRQIRRMSKVVRTGVATAMKCLHETNERNVDAIITATAYGCMEDSETFLKHITEQDEALLSPISFIQSTYNTVGAQIALMLKCHSYNNTFVHRGFSFEHALLESMLILNEDRMQAVLTGSADEITDFSFNVFKRFGLYKTIPVSNLNLFNSTSKGSIAGQGAAFFLLSGHASENDYAKLDALEMLYKPGQNEITKHIQQFLLTQELTKDDIDLVITGKNGDARNDLFYNEIGNNIFKNIPSINYKHLCGEYPTSSSFAMWLAANIIRQNKLPVCFKNETPVQKNFERILVCNNYQNRYISLILLSSCNK